MSRILMTAKKTIKDPEMESGNIVQYIESGILPVFRPRYAKDLYEHMLNARPYDTFAAACGTTVEITDAWLKIEPSFKRAKELGDPAFKKAIMDRLLDANRGDNGAILKIVASYFGGITEDGKAEKFQPTQLIITNRETTEKKVENGKDND